MILPRWVSDLPVIRSLIFHPVITLRSDPALHVVRWGNCPDGEVGFGATVNQTLDEAKTEHLEFLRQTYNIRVVGAYRVVGTDFYPEPKIAEHDGSRSRLSRSRLICQGCGRDLYMCTCGGTGPKR